MPDRTLQEILVSNHWLDAYDPVNDVYMQGLYDYIGSDGVTRYGDFVIMDDGVGFFDHDRDGWWDVARRENDAGEIEEFNGYQWRVLGPASGDGPELGDGGSNQSSVEPLPQSSDWVYG